MSTPSVVIVIDAATFKILFPEFVDVPDARITLGLAGAEGELSATLWGNCYAKAVYWLTAHELSLALARQAEGDDGGSVATGRIQSASVEGLSVSFAVPTNSTANADWLSQTPYGQAFAALARRCLQRAWLSW